MKLDLYRIEKDAPIYRYLSLSQFLSFLEKKKTYFTKVTLWDDPYEDILRRFPVKDSPFSLEEFRIFRHFYAQSWSLDGNSDAMWRIYSKNQEGILIKTTIEKIKKIKSISSVLCGRIEYFDNIKVALNRLFRDKSENTDMNIFKWALLKRSSFGHEKEVRFVTTDKRIDSVLDTESDYIEVELDPSDFIEEIILDPRAAIWYLETIKAYCQRYGLSIEPYKSKLYEYDPKDLGGLTVEFS